MMKMKKRSKGVPVGCYFVFHHQRKLLVFTVILTLAGIRFKGNTGKLINPELGVNVLPLLEEKNGIYPNELNEISKSTVGRKSTFNNQTLTVTKENEGNSFSMKIFEKNDIVSNSIRFAGWERKRVLELNKFFIAHSKNHNLNLSNLTFIDIGANVGWFTFNMAALGVNVLAFEPMKENVQLIRDSLALSDNVASGVSDRITLYPFGLGAKDAICYIYSGDNNVGDGHVKCVENESDVKHQDDYTIRGRIPVHRLDDVINIDEEDLHIVAIKMDTEGYEAHVLEGGSKVLLEGGADAILSEFVKHYIVGKGGDPVQFMKKMGDAEYHVEMGGKSLSTEEMIARVETNEGFGGMDITLKKKFN